MSTRKIWVMQETQPQRQETLRRKREAELKAGNWKQQQSEEQYLRLQQRWIDRDQLWMETIGCSWSENDCALSAKKFQREIGRRVIAQEKFTREQLL